MGKGFIPCHKRVMWDTVCRITQGFLSFLLLLADSLCFSCFCTFIACAFCMSMIDIHVDLVFAPFRSQVFLRGMLEIVENFDVVDL